MQKQNAQKHERPKHSKNQRALPITIIVFFTLGLLGIGVIGNRFVTHHSVRIAFVTTNVLSLLTLAVIALQTLIYRRQSEIMDGQLVATEKAADAAYIAQRAYIGIANLTMTSTSLIPPVTAQLIVGATPTLHVTWHNSGSTPARNFRAIPYLVFGEKPEWKGFIIDDDDSDISGSFLPAGKDITVSYPQNETGFPPVTQEMLNDINSGKKRLYAMVIGVYIDYADKTRWFETGAIYKFYDGAFTELHEYNKQE